MIQIAGLFGAIQAEVSAESMPARLAHTGAMIALSLCTLAARRNVDAALIADVAELEQRSYNLAALTAAPPVSVED